MMASYSEVGSRSVQSPASTFTQGPSNQTAGSLLHSGHHGKHWYNQGGQDYDGEGAQSYHNGGGEEAREHSSKNTWTSHGNCF